MKFSVGVTEKPQSLSQNSRLRLREAVRYRLVCGFSVPSVVIPANNEEKYLGKCLDSIKLAARLGGWGVEVVVVLNRCTDRTEKIARAGGAAVVFDESRNLSRIRNHGAAAASGEVIVTIDADSWMSPNMLGEIAGALQSGKYIGGGVRIVQDRKSLGIAVSMFLLDIAMFFTRLSGGLYWCRRADFQAVGGFNEQISMGEDLDFARRLRWHGKKRGMKFTMLRKAHITTSSRKFDRFGDWFLFKLLFCNQREIIQGLRGKDDSFANRFFYDFKR